MCVCLCVCEIFSSEWQDRSEKGGKRGPEKWWTVKKTDKLRREVIGKEYRRVSNYETRNIMLRAPVN